MRTRPETGYLNKKIETGGSTEVRRLQEAKLAKQLDYLFARSEFYQEKFTSARIRRKDYRHLHDLERFPFTTKDELRESQAVRPPLGKHIACTLMMSSAFTVQQGPRASQASSA